MIDRAKSLPGFPTETTARSTACGIGSPRSSPLILEKGRGEVGDWCRQVMAYLARTRLIPTQSAQMVPLFAPRSGPAGLEERIWRRSLRGWLGRVPTSKATSPLFWRTYCAFVTALPVQQICLRYYEQSQETFYFFFPTAINHPACCRRDTIVSKKIHSQRQPRP